VFYLLEDLSKFPKVSFQFIKTEQKDRVFTIRLNRPEKRNAFTPTMVNEIAFALEFANSQPAIWCVIIESEGTVFCAGMDLITFQNPDLNDGNISLPPSIKEVNLGDAFKNLTKPSIAKVQGNVLAGGFLLIAGCTFVVATPNVEFSLPEVKRGLFPMQVMATLMQIIPKRKVLEMAILGKKYSGEEALHLGLVTHLSAIEEVDETCTTLTAEILENSPFAIQKGIEALKEIAEIPSNEHFSFLAEKLKELKKSEDAKEGIAAFKEKRKPRWLNK
jgi:enoyl-CoA hydratase/carnithine racemase